MALSEHEQRMLDAIEHGLFQDDPKFASSVNPARIRRRRPILSAVLFVLGLAALIVGMALTGLMMSLWWGVAVAVAGFVLMVTGVGLFVYGASSTHDVASASKASSTSSSLSSRMEERFRRRFEDR